MCSSDLLVASIKVAQRKLELLESDQFDQLPYVVGLIVPDPEWTAEWCVHEGRKCDFAALAHDPDYVKALGAAVDRVNAELSVIEKVRRFIIADEPFTVENQQLTPSIKIRRHVIREIYGPRLDALYKR